MGQDLLDRQYFFLKFMHSHLKIALFFFVGQSGYSFMPDHRGASIACWPRGPSRVAFLALMGVRVGRGQENYYFHHLSPTPTRVSMGGACCTHRYDLIDVLRGDGGLEGHDLPPPPSGGGRGEAWLC